MSQIWNGLSEEAKKPFRDETIKQQQFIKKEASNADGEAAVKKVEVRSLLMYILFLKSYTWIMNL